MHSSAIHDSTKLRGDDEDIWLCPDWIDIDGIDDCGRGGQVAHGSAPNANRHDITSLDAVLNLHHTCIIYTYIDIDIQYI